MISTTAKPVASRSMLVTLASVASVVAYVVLGFLPAQKALNAKRRELTEKQRVIQNASQKNSTIADLEARLTAARKHVDAWRQHARLESNAVVLLGELTALAAKSGVILHRLSPQDPTPFETLRQHSFDVEIEGAYSQVVDFIRGLELRPETLWVSHLEMKPAQENGANVQCGLRIVVFADNRGNSG